MAYLEVEVSELQRKLTDFAAREMAVKDREHQFESLQQELSSAKTKLHKHEVTAINITTD